MPDYFYYFTCPLCLQDVDVSQTDSYRVLPLDYEKASIFNERPACDEYECIRINGHRIEWNSGYPDLDYINRAWVLHMRCISFVNHLPPLKLYQLLDLVEPTSPLWSNPPRSQHGAFYAQSIHKEEYMEEYMEQPMEEPVPAVSHMKRIMASLLGALIVCISPRKKHVRVKPPSLPAEIWDMVLQYDIGRLLFVTKTASQVADPYIQSREPSSSPRFTFEILDLTGPTIQIHLISTGGRSYISNLSNPIYNSGAHDNVKCFDLCGSKYLAVKSDGVSVVDIAFEQEQDSQRKWLLHNSTHPFHKEVSRIKDANFQGLWISRDSLKCRAIVPSHRGPEPYFHEEPYSPDHCWVNSGYLIEFRLTELQDPSIYFNRATYIPFTNMKRINIDFLSMELGIRDMHVNDDEPKDSRRYLTVTFSEPPSELKLLACSEGIFPVFHFPFIQFKVNDEWLPPLNR